MKKLSISVVTLSTLVFFNVSNAQKKSVQNSKLMTTKSPTVKDIGLNLSNGNPTVRPQDDFYDYVNGGWMKTAKIPADKPSWGSFNELREKTDNSSLEILNKILGEKYPEGSEGKKIQDLYATFSDVKTRDAQGINPIKSDLAKIDAINSIADLQKYLVEATKTGDNPFYNWGASADLKNSNMNAIYLGGPSLGLGRDYYQKKSDANSKVLAEYQNYVASMLDVLGTKDSEQGAMRIVAFENRLASYLLTLEQNRDAELRYNPETNEQLKTLVTHVDLPSYLSEVGVSTDKVILGELNYYKNMDSFMNERTLPLLKEYMKFHLLSGNAESLSQKLDQMKFDFFSKYLQGQQEQRPMDKRGLSLVNGVLGEAFGKLYVEKYFPPEAKAQMLTMIDYIKKGFKQHIADLKWMSATTKAKAQEKLSKFTVKVAYPDKWKDYSKLILKSPEEGGTLYSNLQNVSDWSYQKKLDKVGKPVDKSEWGMTPQTVNAYYSSSNNEIVFPAAILQPPFFNFKADPAVNFGGIGAVIGHEISHGFDDSGSKFDGDGNLNNWWTDADRANFDMATKKLGEQYSAYEPVKGSFVNGKFTMGENIGDLGGSSVAYDALQMYLKDHGNPGKISGLTQDQRFFMSWATVWRTKATDKSLSNQVKTDPHSPGLYRSYGPIINLDAFQKAFSLKPGDKLYKSPEDRIRIW
ncbi:MAG: M13 family metallopeptidase [Chryseobacterium sp.]|nr:M13 family metallopeptidase [Chryseobacterium sp.]